MIDQKGISANNGMSMAWSDLVAVSAYKIDAITKVLTYLVFDHECGEYLEFTNEDMEFQQIMDALDGFLDLPEGWRSRLDAVNPDDKPIEIWKKLR